MAQQQVSGGVLPHQRGNLSSAQWPVTGEMVHGKGKVAPQFYSDWSQFTEEGHDPGANFTGSTWGDSFSPMRGTPQSLNMSKQS